MVVETVPEPVEADRHPRAILPASLRDATRDHETVPLALDRITPLGPIRERERGYLPTLVLPPALVPPVPWLTLYDLTATGPMQTRGRGAPLAQRLFVEVLTAVPTRRPRVDRRTAGDPTRPVRVAMAAVLGPREVERADALVGATGAAVINATSTWNRCAAPCSNWTTCASSTTALSGA